MPSRRRSLLLATAALAFCVSPSRAALVGVVRVNGTGSGTGGMRVLGRAFMDAHPGVMVEVQPALGSSGGISALLAGQIDVAVSNRLPRDAERARLVAVEYARTPFVIAVSRDLGVKALSTEQLAGLYEAGAVTFPNGRRARPVLRTSDAADTELVKSMSPVVAAALAQAAQRRGMLDANTDTEAADLLESTPGAFGASTLALIESERRALVALTLDGKVPSVDHLASGAWPFFKHLYLITTTSPSAEAQAFAAFVQSATGRQLLRSHGHLPS